MLTLVVTSLAVFWMLEVLPGNAAQVILGDTATPQALVQLQIQLGLDKPAPLRYLDWIGHLLQGQTDTSTAYDAPTSELILERLKVTLPPAGMAMCITVVVAIAAGIYAASQHHRWGDTGVMAMSQLGLSIPNFWLAILLILIFAVKLGWFSAGGFPGWSQASGGGFWRSLQALFLPACALAGVQIAILTRVTRSAVIDCMREDYVRTARAKGLSKNQVLWRHVLQNAMVPILTILGLQLGNLITGAIIVENVFVLPGIGRLVFQAIANRDMCVVRDVVLLLAAMVIAINFTVDVLYAMVDPRLSRRGV